MNQNVAIKKAMQSIENLTTINEEQYKIILHHLWLMYGIGFDEGRRKEPKQRLGQFFDGMLINSYSSIEQAVRETKISKKRILQTIKRKSKIYACSWEYLKEEG
jgi:hypothetical protein